MLLPAVSSGTSVAGIVGVVLATNTSALFSHRSSFFLLRVCLRECPCLFVCLFGGCVASIMLCYVMLCYVVFVFVFVLCFVLWTTVRRREKKIILLCLLSFYYGTVPSTVAS